MTPRMAAPALAALAALALTAPAASAQGSANGQFGISPARRDVVARPPTGLVPTRVYNSTQVGFDVTVFPVLLHQNPTGEFAFSEDARDLNAAKTILGATPAKFHLGPGDSRTVAIRWNLLPRGARAAYMGLVFQGVPVVGGKRNVSVTDRLLSINFLRLPGHYLSRGRFAGMDVTQLRARVLRFLPNVKNTGDVVDSPKHTMLVIRRAGGGTVLRQKWVGDVVLPGVTRQFAIDVTKVLPAGDYVAEAQMDFGQARHKRVRTRFHLTGPNTLPSPQLTVSSFAGTGTIGKPAHLTAGIASTGTAPVSVRMSLSLFHITSNARSATVPVAVRRVSYSNLAPGAKRSLDQAIGKVEKGHYRAILRWRDPTNVVRSLSAEFDATKARSAWQNFKRWWSDHGVLAVGLLALLILLLVIAWFVQRQRRLERRLAERAEPGVAPPGGSPPVAPVVPAPAARREDERVNINTADAVELQRLPGVGPKAAARIVAHREEYGSFASVDDLAKVGGFGAARLAELRDRATV